ncbi:hypothetical protein [Spirulina major]|uniref:hypothetical protein n=1 Tax=Spirulina major TaxID=270636 RepID=UPI0009322EBD|nr:hypothetical protein [Spirulina major]
MERGLLWLPLLVGFIGLAWAGWNEWKKVDTYQQWAEAFDQAKYDLYAVLGQKAEVITWGYPTRNGILNPQSFSLRDVVGIYLQVNGQRVTGELPRKGKPMLEFVMTGDRPPILIPFTEIPLAAKWQQYLDGIRTSHH